MNEIIAVLLGIIQGITEFLPVSSSGHLELAKGLLPSEYLPQENLLMTITLHAATALSTIVIFRKDILEIITGLLEGQKNNAFYFLLHIVLSMIPAAVVGLFLEEQIALLFNGNIALVGCMLLITGGLLLLANRAQSNNTPISGSSALLIGTVQAIAILPGISRSGATIATAVLLGIDKEKAARFSFLMVIPLIFGSMAKSILSSNSSDYSTDFGPLIIGFFAAFITGILACKWMIALVKKAQLKGFSIYCFLVGGLTLILNFFA